MSLMRGVVGLSFGVLLSVANSRPASAQVLSDPYYDFLMGHRLESQGDVPGALAAFERAAAAEPRSAEIRAEIAAFHMRHNRPEEAEKAARTALALNDGSMEAHRVLGLLLAGNPQQAPEAIQHLERMVPTPAGATDVSVRFTLGRLYLLTGAATQAIDVLQRLLDEQPFLLQARLTLAQAQSAAGLGADAIDTLKPAAENDPRLNGTIAQYYERAGRWSEAIEAYSKALAFNPSSYELQMRLVKALLAVPGRGNARRALDALKPLLARNGKDQVALYLEADAQLRIGDVSASERAARAILTVDPESLSGAYALAQAYIQARRYKDVIAELEAFLTTTTRQGRERGRLFGRLSFAYQSLGQHDKAIETLKKARTTDSNTNLDVYLAQAFLTAKRYDEAAKFLEDVQARHPGEARFMHLQARALFHSGAPSRALALIEALVKAHPDNVQSHLVLAELYAQASRVNEGLDVLDRAAQQFPNDPAIPFRRGAILSEAERHVEAERAFRQVLDIEPDHAEALNYLGYMLAERGERLDEAIRFIRRALDIDTENPSYLDSLGWAYFKKGNLAEAEKNLSRAAAMLPSNSVVQSHLGDLLARLGRYRDATEAWTRALQGDGDDIDRGAIERKIRDARAKAR